MTMIINPYAFGPPAVTDPFWANVSALLHFDGADGSTVFIDQTARSWAAGGNAQIDTALSKFGGASGLFDGSGDYVYSNDSPLLDFGTGDFTAECFAYLQVNNTLQYIFSRYSGSGSLGGFAMAVNASGKLMLVHQGVAFLTAGATTLPTGAWVHLAIARASGVVKLFVDGVEDASASSSTDFTAGIPTNSYIGVNYDGATFSQALNGNMDEFRITKGVARYTATFTPPAAPFPNS